MPREPKKWNQRKAFLIPKERIILQRSLGPTPKPLEGFGSQESLANLLRPPKCEKTILSLQTYT